jgi:hypothetical protein
VNLGYYIFAVDDDRRLYWRTQSHMQDYSLFSNVDLLAGEHRVDPRPHARLFGQLYEELERIVRDAIFE